MSSHSLMKYLFFVVNLLSCFVAQSQQWEVGGGFTSWQYRGDLAPSYRPFAMRPGADVWGRFNTATGFNFRAQASMGRLGTRQSSSPQTFHQQQGRAFGKTMYEGAALVEYNFLDFRMSRSRYASQWTPYWVGGLSMYMVDELNNVNFAIPVGVGLKTIWRDNWNLSVEFSPRFTNKDAILDDFGYPRNDPFATTGSTFDPSDPLQRQARKLNYPATLQRDTYYLVQFSVSYVFQRIYCPRP